MPRYAKPFDNVVVVSDPERGEVIKPGPYGNMFLEHGMRGTSKSEKRFGYLLRGRNYRRGLACVDDYFEILRELKAIYIREKKQWFVFYNSHPDVNHLVSKILEIEISFFNQVLANKRLRYYHHNAPRADMRPFILGQEACRNDEGRDANPFSEEDWRHKEWDFGWCLQNNETEEEQIRS